MNRRRVGVIGSLNVDYVSYVRDNPRKGETILADDFSIVPGGKGANQAFALGWKISLGCAAVFVLLAYFLGKPKEKTPAKRGKFQK